MFLRIIIIRYTHFLIINKALTWKNLGVLFNPFSEAADFFMLHTERINNLPLQLRCLVTLEIFFFKFFKLLYFIAFFIFFFFVNSKNIFKVLEEFVYNFMMLLNQNYSAGKEKKAS